MPPGCLWKQWHSSALLQRLPAGLQEHGRLDRPEMLMWTSEGLSASPHGSFTWKKTWKSLLGSHLKRSSCFCWQVFVKTGPSSNPVVKRLFRPSTPPVGPLKQWRCWARWYQMLGPVRQKQAPSAHVIYKGLEKGRDLLDPIGQGTRTTVRCVSLRQSQAQDQGAIGDNVAQLEQLGIQNQGQGNQGPLSHHGPGFGTLQGTFQMNQGALQTGYPFQQLQSQTAQQPYPGRCAGGCNAAGHPFPPGAPYYAQGPGAQGQDRRPFYIGLGRYFTRSQKTSET